MFNRSTYQLTYYKQREDNDESPMGTTSPHFEKSVGSKFTSTAQTAVIAGGTYLGRQALNIGVGQVQNITGSSMRQIQANKMMDTVFYGLAVVSLGPKALIVPVAQRATSMVNAHFDNKYNEKERIANLDLMGAIRTNQQGGAYYGY